MGKCQSLSLVDYCLNHGLMAMAQAGYGGTTATIQYSGAITAVKVDSLPRSSYGVGFPKGAMEDLG